ncbi:RhuM family protein [Thermophilibacter sp.]
MSTEKNIVLFESADGEVSLPVRVDPAGDEIWLNRSQLAALYGRDVKTIGKHIANALREELAGSEDRTVAKFATVRLEGDREVVRQVEHYNLDIIISVGYRVKSRRGVEFRRWATDVLRRYVVTGHAENEHRLEQLGQVAKAMARIPNDLGTRQVLDIVQSYTAALDLLDDYDHMCVTAPDGAPSTYVLGYEECRGVIDSMRFGQESSLFGVEKDESFKGAIGNVFQSFGGRDLYPTLEEKAASLLYFVVKDHSFLDGNKRIAATIFLYFLDRNGALFTPAGDKVIDDSTLVAVTLLIAESNPEEKDVMVALVRHFLHRV